MIDSNPMPLMTQIVANSSVPNYGTQIPQSTKFTMEQQYQAMQQALQQQVPQSQSIASSNPYDDYIKVLSSCSDLVKQKIIQDEEYQRADNDCEMLIKQLWYTDIIPKVMQYQQGRVAFEKLYNITRQLKEDFTQEEIKMTQNMQFLMSDPVVLARLQELQTNQKKTKTRKSNVAQVENNDNGELDG